MAEKLTFTLVAKQWLSPEESDNSIGRSDSYGTLNDEPLPNNAVLREAGDVDSDPDGVKNPSENAPLLARSVIEFKEMTGVQSTLHLLSIRRMSVAILATAVSMSICTAFETVNKPLP